MFSKIITPLNALAYSRGYWLTLITVGTALLIVALLYQHLLDELPCVVCIQVRLWVSLLVLVSLIGFFTRNARWPNFIVNISVVAIGIVLTERSYLLLGTERGFIFGDCGFSLGMPAWFAIEEWLPWMYRIETSCGYTPELLLGITMAEVLIVLSVCLLLCSLGILVSSLIKRQ